MPLRLTPAQSLADASGLPVAQVYAIVDRFTYDRRQRLVSFGLGYYLNEAACLPASSLLPLAVALPTGFSFQMDPAAAMGDPQQVMEAYAAHELLALLGQGATIETVP